MLSNSNPADFKLNKTELKIDILKENKWYGLRVSSQSVSF